MRTNTSNMAILYPISIDRYDFLATAIFFVRIRTTVIKVTAINIVIICSTPINRIKGVCMIIARSQSQLLMRVNHRYSPVSSCRCAKIRASRVIRLIDRSEFGPALTRCATDNAKKKKQKNKQCDG